MTYLKIVNIAKDKLDHWGGVTNFTLKTRFHQNNLEHRTGPHINSTVTKLNTTNPDLLLPQRNMTGKQNNIWDSCD